MDPTRKRIEEARILLDPGEVKPNEVPPWLSKRLTTYRQQHGKVIDYSPDRASTHMLQEDTLRQLFSTGLDHYGTSDRGPFKCCHQGLNFVSEPYEFTTKTAQCLDAFCAALGGLKWHVSSDTWWNPGHTLRITIHEKKA